MIDSIFYVAVLIMSVVIHEFAHGYSAYLMGDDMARLSGRLTLNPIKHLDLFGSVILPLLLVLSQSGFIIGWAKPVPYNPNNLKNYKKGTFVVAISGVLANLLIAIIFGLFIRFALYVGVPISSPFFIISQIIVITNIVLFLFNLIPIPPLDGSKILYAFIPARFRHIENFLETYGVIGLIAFIIFIWKYFSPLIGILFKLIAGIPIGLI